jgi:tripartite-type tricarboxylate transporter receptor subunit TctC
MPITRCALVAAVSACMLAAAPLPVTAQGAFPNKGITVVVPFAPGGPTDIIARIVADHMGRTLGQQVLVENTAGAGGTLGSGRVSKATPDGYLLVMGNLGTHAASMGLYGSRLSYDPRTDFEPVMNVAGTPMLVVAKKDLPVKDFKEFVAWVKANAGKVNYGTGGVGATSHLACLFLDSLMEAKPTHVPFRGSGPALNALLGGHVDYVCDQTVGVVPSIQADAVKGLVVATPARLSVVPNVPTSTEQGMPAYQAVGWARRRRSSSGSMRRLAQRSRTRRCASACSSSALKFRARMRSRRPLSAPTSRLRSPSGFP